MIAQSGAPRDVKERCPYAYIQRPLARRQESGPPAACYTPRPMRDRLTILNAFVHDVATGTWIGTLLLLTMLHREAQQPPWFLAGHLVPGLERKFLVVTWVSLAVIMATGVIRMVTWKVFGWTGDMEKSRIQLLKVKHALLGAVFAAGTLYQFLLVYS